MRGSLEVLSTVPPRAPALPIVTAFIIGAVLEHSASVETSLLIIPVVLFAAMEAARRGKAFAATVLALGGFFFLGAVSHRIARCGVEHRSLLEIYEELRLGAREWPTLVEGRLIKEPEPGVDASVLLLMVERVVISGRRWACRGTLQAGVRGELRFRSELDRLHPDDSIRIWVSLQRPRSYENPGRFDLEAYMDRLGVTLTGSVKSALLVERIEPGFVGKSVLPRVRRYARKQITGACRRIGVEASETPGVVLALVVGDRFLIPPWAERLYQEAGTFHVIAISGAHVGLVALLLYGGLRRWGLDQNPALLILMACLPAYAALTGGRPSVVRAVLLSSSVVGAKLLSLDTPGINGLAISALFLLVFRPLDLYEPGFQLSFVGTAAILVFCVPLARTFTTKLGKLGDWIAISLAAQIGVLPILAWHFGRITPAAVLANLLVMPLAGALIVAGALLVILAPIPWLGEGVAWLAWLFVKGMTVSSQLAAALPGGSIRVPSPGATWAVLYFASLALVLCCRGRWRRAAAVFSLLLVLWLVLRPSPPTSPSVLRLTAFDVGRGDAILLELPGGERVLVDGGGSFSPAFDIGERVVVPALLARGIRSLDAVVLTHPDGDHIGGLPAVLANLRVKEIWEGKPAWDRMPYRFFRERARARGIHVEHLASGDGMSLGPVRFDVLSSTYGTLGSSSSNDDSLVLLIRYGRASVLLTGDIGKEIELELLRSRKIGSVDVLKVGHHGSRSSTSPAFLEAVVPRIALISTRSSGFFRMPSVGVLVRLRNRGITSLRTDRDGAVTVSLNEHGIMRVETFRP